MTDFNKKMITAGFQINDNNIWCPSDIKEFSYNDGDAAELYLLDVVSNATDKSCYSVELVNKMIDWPSIYHLSSRRSNLLRPFSMQFEGKRILEIGCGCGAITRFLGECGAEVVAVEGSLRRATIARKRCSELNNITVICSPSDKLPDIGKFDFVLLIGVLEYARSFLGTQGQHELLDFCSSKLRDEGQLFVAIENKLGIKYFAGAAEDHVGQPMFGLNNSYSSNGVATFGRHELKSLLNGAGLNYIEEYIPLPDYKMPSEIVTPLGWKSYSNELSQIAIESAHKDAQGIVSSIFSLEQGLKSIWQNNIAADLSNSFLFVASAKEIESKGNELLYHYSDGRPPEYNKTTIITVTEENKIEVHAFKSHSETSAENKDFYHNIDSHVEFFPGKSLWIDMVDILNRPGWEISQICEWVKCWIGYIKREEKIDSSIDKNTLLPGKFSDALPFNILVNYLDETKFIDLEWITNDKVNLGYVVFRGVLHSLLRVTSVAYSVDGENIKIPELIKKILLRIDLNITEDDIKNYWDCEYQFMQKTQLKVVDDPEARFCHTMLKTRILPAEYAMRNEALNVRNMENLHKITELRTQNEEELRKIDAGLKKIDELTLQQKQYEAKIGDLTYNTRELTYNNEHMQTRLAYMDSVVHNKDQEIARLNAEMLRLINTNSWKMTKPLRFIMRLLRGQYQVALQPVKSQIRNYLKDVYYKMPAGSRDKLLNIAFKVRPGWFLHHPEYIRKNTNIVYSSEINHQWLVDFRLLPATLQETPGKIAVHCHIFYYDIIDEFCHHLAQVPFKIDVFVSVASEEGQVICQRELLKLSNIEKLVVDIVPNRGRDIAPMFAHFGEQLKNYDYIAHIQSKKSLYNAGATIGWREYLLSSLFGSRENVLKIFTQFTSNSKLGIIYPQVFDKVPYAAFSWLANRADGNMLCSRMNLEMPDAYFDFPAGSMFWARTDAIRPLFDLNLTLDDFPEEAEQKDGTLAHALERLLGIVPTATHYDSLIIKDLYSPSWSTFRIDQQYLCRGMENCRQFICAEDIRVVAFDIFDTILTRPLFNPEHTKEILLSKLEDKEQYLYQRYRTIAESQARSEAGRDIGLREIYKVFARLTKLSDERCLEIANLEIETELASVYLRPDVKTLMDMANDAGKKVILISDMFLPQEVIIRMLDKNQVTGWEKLYLSSEIGLRKDTGELYKYVFDSESVSGPQIVMVGDNERSDIQIPADYYSVRCLHILRTNALAKCLNEYRTFVNDKNFTNDINNELTIGLVVQKNLNKIAGFSSDDLRLYRQDPYYLGYNLVGPILTAFSAWLFDEANKQGITDLYFLSREGKIIKQVFDKWSETYHNTPKSIYLQLSRRAVNVARMKEFSDIQKIAEIDYFPNEVSAYLLERFGLVLDDETWEDIFAQGFWKKGQKVEIRNKNISPVKALLEFLSTTIYANAEIEKQALSQYLDEIGLSTNQHSALVDVGYMGTIQKSLIALLDKPIHGFYMATAAQIRDDIPVTALTEGCFVSKGHSKLIDSRIFTKSFSLEQLLSANDSQIVKYVKDDEGNLQQVFKPLQAAEIETKEIRNLLQNGIMDYVSDAVKIKQELYPEFIPSLLVADTLYREFVDLTHEHKNTVLEHLILDDDYCGRGLVN